MQFFWFPRTDLAENATLSVTAGPFNRSIMEFGLIGATSLNRFRRKSVQLVKPVLQALLVAEKVLKIEDGGMVIMNTIQCVRMTPATPPEELEDGRTKITGGEVGAPWAYVSLTDVCANTSLELQFVNLTRNKVLSAQVGIQCTYGLLGGLLSLVS